MRDLFGVTFQTGRHGRSKLLVPDGSEEIALRLADRLFGNKRINSASL